MASNPNPVSWFEIPVSDFSRAKNFYEAVFQVPVTVHEVEGATMGNFPIDTSTYGATGSLILADGYRPSHDGTLIYIHVDAIDTTLEAIEQQGGTTLMPKTSIGPDGFIARFEDSEGNRVGLHQRPED